jgi:parallel beta-helix repeat protein
VQNNFIGVNLTASAALANGGYGVNIAGSNNSIGTGMSAASNTIADNSLGGVFVSAGSGNTIRHNAIYANAGGQSGKGIVLTPGSNNNVTAPMLNKAVLVGSTLTVTGTFTALQANVPYVLEFFANPTGDAEGKVFLGEMTVTPMSTGTLAFTFTTTTSVASTDPLITATLTDAAGDTSAFSTGVTVS